MKIISQENRTAIKNHECILCDGDIKKKESYVDQKINHEGSIYSNRYHLHCYELIELLKIDYDDEGIIEDSFNEYLHEYIHEHISVAEIAKFVHEHIKK